jgi:hypothetical protein
VDSSLSLKWPQPVVVNEATLKAFAEVMSAFIGQAKADAVVACGLAPNEITTADQVVELSDAAKEVDRRVDLAALARTLQEIEKTSFSVQLNNGVRLHGLELREVLTLPNVGPRSLASIQYSNDSSRYTLSVEWSNRHYGGSVAANIRAPYNIVDYFEQQLSDRLSESTNSWWPLRSARGKSALFWLSLIIIFATLFCVADAAILAFVNMKSDRGVVPIFAGWAAIALTFVLSMFVAGRGEKLIDWLVTPVEYRFGGGVALNERKASLRRALFYTFPILGLALPLLSALLAKVIIG